MEREMCRLDRVAWMCLVTLEKLTFDFCGLAFVI